MNVLTGLGDDALRAQVAQHGGDQQAAGEVRPDAHEADVKVVYAQLAQDSLVRAVRDLRAGDRIGQLGDDGFVFIDDHDLVAQLRQLEAEVTAKTAQADDKNGFHNGTS